MISKDLPIVNDPPRAVNTHRAAARLGVSERTLRSLIASGALRSFKIGARRLVPVDAIDVFIEDRMEGH